MTGNEHPDLPFAAAAARNAAPIAQVLRAHLPAEGKVLEIASGTGQHVVHFATEHPGLHWQPSETTRDQCALIDERVRRAGLSNVLPAQLIDARDPWDHKALDVIFAVNLVHMVSWATTQALVSNAGRALKTGGILFLYGPYKRHGEHVSDGNRRFDASLRAGDSDAGIRDAEAVMEAAIGGGFHSVGSYEMPANNLSLLFRRS